MGEPIPGTQPSARPSEDRLDSWKEIAAYLDRDVTTVQRWEKREGMPVHRHAHDRMGSVYAFRAELDAWARGRNNQTADNGRTAQENESDAPLLIIASVCWRACKSHPIILISASFGPSAVRVITATVYSGRREAGLVMTSPGN
jgi:hypothetical protein